MAAALFNVPAPVLYKFWRRDRQFNSIAVRVYSRDLIPLLKLSSKQGPLLHFIGKKRSEYSSCACGFSLCWAMHFLIERWTGRTFFMSQVNNFFSHFELWKCKRGVREITNLDETLRWDGEMHANKPVRILSKQIQIWQQLFVWAQKGY